MGKRELVALLNLSPWCLVMVEWLFLAVPWGCLRFVIVLFPDHTNLLLLNGGMMCRRFECDSYRMPTMAPLPGTLVTEAIAFTRTGQDYLGPMIIKTSERQRKVWVCLFTHMVTHAIHLELLQDMSAEEFLLGFRRFISQRGSPIEIINNNALQFKTASQTLDLLWKKVIRCDDVQN